MANPECERLVKKLIDGGFLKTPLIIEAFRAIDRADFVLPEYLEMAYDDEPLPIGYGQTISQPLTVAFMLELLAPQPGEKILDVGSGSGWKAALVAYCVSAGNALGRVISVECIPELKKLSEQNIGKYPLSKKGVVRLLQGDGSFGVAAEAPFDKIIAGAAAENAIPEIWKTQVNIGGRIVAPVGHSIFVFDKKGEERFETEEYEGFSFVPLKCG